LKITAVDSKLLSIGVAFQALQSLASVAEEDRSAKDTIVPAGKIRHRTRQFEKRHACKGYISINSKIC
jgi:fatty acid-binding protein DegV